MPPARSYEKTYNLADDFSFYGAINVRLSVGYDKNQRELSRQVVRNNILTCFCATESLPPTGLRSNYVSRIPVTPAAGGGTQTANYAVPERTSPSSCRHYVYTTKSRRRLPRITAQVPCAVERFAGAHPSHCVGPFRS